MSGTRLPFPPSDYATAYSFYGSRHVTFWSSPESHVSLPIKGICAWISSRGPLPFEAMVSATFNVQVLTLFTLSRWFKEANYSVTPASTTLAPLSATSTSQTPLFYCICLPSNQTPSSRHRLRPRTPSAPQCPLPDRPRLLGSSIASKAICDDT
jgi:hypothetical protein